MATLKRTFRMVFKDSEKLNHMLALRRQGWSLVSLALIYGVDHSSIYKWCKIKQIKPPHKTIALDLSDIVSTLNITPPKLKGYADYLNMEHRRKFPKLYDLMEKV